MATINVPRRSPPTRIDKYLGINEDSSGDTQLLLGESPNMLDFRIADNYKLKMREGYEELFASLGAYDIQGIWYGKLSGTYYTLFAANGNIYKRVAGVNTSIGTLADARTFFFAFDDKVYMLNGTDYKSWDGTTFETVAGYIPLIATATSPTGGGVANEGINLLTGKKHQTFSGDNSATAYQVAETSLTSVDFVYKAGVLQTLTTDYTVNLTTGIVTFLVAPVTGVDNVDIYWTKGTGSRSEVTDNTYAMFFGGQNDTRIFYFGNGTNKYYYSGLAAGVPSAEYIPALNYREISSNEFAVTDIVRQYDRQIIYTDGGEAWYSYYDPITIGNDTVADFPTYPLNDTVGNIAVGQAQLIQNNPFTIQNGVYEWGATNVRDERNVVYMSKRVQPSMDAVDLSTAITIDWEARREYWLAIGNKVWVYNYRLDVWYKFLLADNVTCLHVINDELHFGTDNGEIMKFDPAYTNDNGVATSARWEMNFYDFDVEYLRKYLTEMWISLKPAAKSSVTITYQTDRVGTSDEYTAIYNLATFATADFADWSFLVNYNPQPFHFKIKAKKFVFLKIILTNDETDEELTLLSMNLPVRTGSKVK
jgi:hypothetical protein